MENILNLLPNKYIASFKKEPFYKNLAASCEKLSGCGNAEIRFKTNEYLFILYIPETDDNFMCNEGNWSRVIISHEKHPNELVTPDKFLYKFYDDKLEEVRVYQA